jgi:hypothetical protein
MKFVVAVGFLFFAAGCGSMNPRQMDAQKAVMTIEDAVREWGTPVSHAKTASGGTKMVWSTRTYSGAEHEYVHPRGPTYGGSASGFSPQKEKVIVLFDERGIMQAWYSERR